jgi:3-oxoadipate enol-lactonase
MILDTSITLHRRGSGRCLVLLHCLGVDRHFWNFVAPLSRELTLVSYDLPGHGETPVPNGPYSIEGLAAQLARLLKRDGIARAHIAGISLGGLIAQAFAATHPQTVDRLVLIDTTARYTEELRAMWAVRAAGARKDGVASLIDGLLKIWFTPQSIADDTAAVRYVRSALRPLAGKIAAPTLIVCGDDDIPSFLDAARWLTENIRGARLEWIAKAKHASVIERPDQALALLRNFLLVKS